MAENTAVDARFTRFLEGSSVVAPGLQRSKTSRGTHVERLRDHPV